MVTAKNSSGIKGVLQDIIGCKWSLAVIEAVRNGVNRPGALERHIEGISAKVLSQRLKKLTRYRVLERTEFAEIPPRVEYMISEKGSQLIEVLDAIQELDEHWLNESETAT